MFCLFIRFVLESAFVFSVTRFSYLFNLFFFQFANLDSTLFFLAKVNLLVFKLFAFGILCDYHLPFQLCHCLVIAQIFIIALNFCMSTLSIQNFIAVSLTLLKTYLFIIYLHLEFQFC